MQCNLYLWNKSSNVYSLKFDIVQEKRSILLSPKILWSDSEMHIFWLHASDIQPFGSSGLLFPSV